MNRKIIITIVLIFIFINGVVYKVTDINSQQRVDMALDQNLKMLRTHYEILLHTQNIAAKTIYDSTINSKEFLRIFSQARDASEEQKVILRKQMQKLLYGKYKRAKTKGVLQYHFVFPNNIVFLRMDEPSKYGDDLTNTRYDFRYVNKTKKPIRGFTQGKISHGFKNVFPVFSKDNKYIGAMEVSFSSENSQEYLTNISHIHTHFLVNKDIYDVKTWQRDDLILKYSQSAEHKNLMITMTKEHTKKKCIVANKIKLEPIREFIDKKIALGANFSTYVEHHKHTDIFAFLAIKNMENKTIAWLVSYGKSEFIDYTLTGRIYVRVFTLIFSIIILYFVIQQIKDKNRQKKQAKRQEYILKQEIKKALDENTKQLQALQQQSKMASMGEMIGAIAHQWRQPLNTISTSIQNLEYDYMDGYLNDEKFVSEFIEKNKKTIKFMSKTIDDFRNFFRVDKDKHNFNIKETTLSVVDMQSAQLKSYNITLNLVGDEFIHYGPQSEYQQVILNIINNAKDVLIEKKIQTPVININLDSKAKTITIKDNAGGIPNNIINRIFEPYFTTKEQGKGTGLGLYMSKMIIEDNMGGSLSVKNSKNGAVFTIYLAVKKTR
jgi:signal transduction histidine kinase